MASFEWGDSEWDIDKLAESLNKDLFGGKKMKKRVLVPDSTVNNKNSHAAQDSDEEQFSKKAKKRMKERMRKKKKKAGETVDGTASDLNENRIKIDSKSKSKQIASKETTDEGSTEKKKRKKKRKSALENSSDVVHPGEMAKLDAEKSLNNVAQKKKKSNGLEGKEVETLPETTEKPKKRKAPDSEMADKNLTAKKRKISDSVEENLGAPQEKRRKRLNRKKRNNSKKNKYKHLALNSKNNMDSGCGISNGDMEKVLTEGESITRTPGSTSQTGKTNTSDASRHQVSASQPETNISPEQNNKDEKKKNKNLKKVINSPSKEFSENLKQTKCLTKTPQKDNGKEQESNSVKKKGGESHKTQPRFDKQKLLHMLKNSTSDSVAQSAANGSSGKEKKKRNRKRKVSESENTNTTEQSVVDQTSNSLSESDSFAHGSLDPAPDKKSCKRLSHTATELKDKATEKLKAARFRFINEQLYNCKGHEALQLFRKDVEAFKVYHQGFQSQTHRWPVNPLDAIIKHVSKRPKQLVIADFGCGDARLGESVPQKVHSFDLVALNDRVTACDMSKTPLADDSVDVAVFCLSLMGTNLNDYILEANRVLKIGGLLKIAEVASRFHNPDQFIKYVSSLGFLLLNKRELSDMFYLMDFKKVKRLKKSPLNVEIKLKPCVYKKR